MFISIEDETGPANIVAWPTLFEKRRRVVLGSSMRAISGRVQRGGEVVHLVAQQLLDLSGDLSGRLIAPPSSSYTPVGATSSLMAMDRIRAMRRARRSRARYVREGSAYLHAEGQDPEFSVKFRSSIAGRRFKSLEDRYAEEFRMILPQRQY